MIPWYRSDQTENADEMPVIVTPVMLLVGCFCGECVVGNNKQATTTAVSNSESNG
jgi:hypothetical protein